MKIIFLNDLRKIPTIQKQLFLKKSIFINLENFYMNEELDANIKQLRINDLLSKDEMSQFKNFFLQTLLNLSQQINAPWWAAYNFTSKNPLSSPLYQNMLYLMCINKIMASNTAEAIFIYCSDNNFINILKKTFHKKALIINKTKSSFSLYNRFKCAPILTNVIFLIRILRRMFLSKKNLSFPQNTKSATIIKSLILPSSFQKNEEYRDLYFHNLLENTPNLSQVLILVNVLNHFKSYLSKIKHSNHSGHQIYPLEYFLTVKDIVNLFLNQIYEYFHVFIKYQNSIPNISFENFNLKTTLIHTLYKELNSNQWLKNLTFFYATKNLSQEIKIKKFIYPFENRSSERLCIKALKHYSPNTSIEGYQHASIHQEHLNFIMLQDEHKITPLPHKIWTTGTWPKEYFIQKGNFPKNLLGIGGALRQNFTEQTQAKKIKKYKIFTIGIVLASGEFEYIGLISFLNQISALKQYRIIIRPHPEISFDVIRPHFKHLNFNFTIDGEIPIEEFLNKIDLIVYASTTVSFEAIFKGIPALCIHYENCLNLDPLFKNNDLKWDIFKPSDFIKSIDEIENLNEEIITKRTQQVRTFISNYFSPMPMELKQNFLL